MLLQPVLAQRKGCLPQATAVTPQPQANGGQTLSPTELSLKLFRSQGYLAEVVERWLPRANVRKDLFNVIDLIAIDGKCIAGVQVTTLSSYRSHVAKLKEYDANLKLWLSSGGQFIMHCWGTRSVNKRKVRRVLESIAHLKPNGRIGWDEEELLDPFKKAKP